MTKLETALDQVKKAYPKLMPADAALLATALTVTGRHAIALYEGEQYTWPEDNERLQTAMIPHIKITQEAIESNTTKKSAKTTVEEEPVTIAVGLTPDYSSGEKVLQDRKDLKTLLSDVLQEGVEFVYAPSDIGWQWALDRANWSTIAGQEISRRIKIKTAFTEGAVGVETGAQSAKKRSSKKSAEPVAEVLPEQPEPMLDAEMVEE
ncbi:MAG TPA: hypothetical protein VG944_24155 [Fimbriimonas sp.]|nr:hypothetical protein [Fimbriimonas sp.]